jgi:phosphohistidine phosphatase SixA
MFQLFLRSRAQNFIKARLGIDEGFRARSPERDAETDRLRVGSIMAAIDDAPAPQQAGEIYDATPGELLALLDQHADAGTVLLVGHNPGMERLVALLVEGRSDEFRGMPPGALAVLHLDGALEPGNARLDAFWSP